MIQTRTQYNYWEMVKAAREDRFITNAQVRKYRQMRNTLPEDQLYKESRWLILFYGKCMRMKWLKSNLARKHYGYGYSAKVA
jgi:hypothetical protein